MAGDLRLQRLQEVSAQGLDATLDKGCRQQLQLRRSRPQIGLVVSSLRPSCASDGTRSCTTLPPANCDRKDDQKAELFRAGSDSDNDHVAANLALG